MVSSILHNRGVVSRAIEFILTKKTPLQPPRIFCPTENGKGTDNPTCSLADVRVGLLRKGPEMTCEDIKFYETVENGIVHLEDLHYAIPLPFTHQNIVMRNTSRITAAICLISKGYARKVDEKFEGQK